MEFLALDMLSCSVGAVISQASNSTKYGLRIGTTDECSPNHPDDAIAVCGREVKESKIGLCSHGGRAGLLSLPSQLQQH